LDFVTARINRSEQQRPLSNPAETFPHSSRAIIAKIAASLTEKATGVAVDYAKVRILEQCRGQYNEEDIKARILCCGADPGGYQGPTKQ